MMSSFLPSESSCYEWQNNPWSGNCPDQQSKCGQSYNYVSHTQQCSKTSKKKTTLVAYTLDNQQ
jgi:hypothetical protein